MESSAVHACAVAGDDAAGAGRGRRGVGIGARRGDGQRPVRIGLASHLRAGPQERIGGDVRAGVGGAVANSEGSAYGIPVGPGVLVGRVLRTDRDAAAGEGDAAAGAGHDGASRGGRAEHTVDADQNGDTDARGGGGPRGRVVVRVLLLGGLDHQAAGGERGVGTKVAGRGHVVGVRIDLCRARPGDGGVALHHTHRASIAGRDARADRLGIGGLRGRDAGGARDGDGGLSPAIALRPRHPRISLHVGVDRGIGDRPGAAGHQRSTVRLRVGGCDVAAGGGDGEVPAHGQGDGADIGGDGGPIGRGRIGDRNSELGEDGPDDVAPRRVGRGGGNCHVVARRGRQIDVVVLVGAAPSA